MNRPLLMIPGPIDPPEEVLRRCGQRVIPHYEGDFPAFHARLVGKMKEVFGTPDGQVLIPNGSGTTAVNMMLASLCTPEDSVLVVHNGAWGDYAQRNLDCLGIPNTPVRGAPGTAVDPERVRDEMKRGRHRFIYVTHNESSTASVNPLPPLGRISREFDALLLVDAVSSVGGMVIDMDAAGADVVAGASQKCLELPPGLAPVAVGTRAWRHMEEMPRRRVPYVLDLMMWRWSLEARGESHPQLTTGATTMLDALDWMVDAILAEGILPRQERFRAAGDRLKCGLGELGFQVAADPAYASPVMTEFILPHGVLAAQLRAWYMTRHNLMVGGGSRTNRDGQAISMRVAHFGTAGSHQRIDHFVHITREFMAGRDSG